MPEIKRNAPALNMAKVVPEGITSRFEIIKNTIKATNAKEPDRKVAIIDIEGPIGFDAEKWWNDEEQDKTGKAVRAKLAEINALDVDEIKVNIIESPGGEIEEGIAIYEALIQSKAKVTTEIIGWGASMATTIFLAGDVRKIGTNAIMLDHSAMVFGYGYMNSTELQNAMDTTELLDRRLNSIKSKHGVNMEAIKPFMDADNSNGKWYEAQDALDMGMATEVYEPFTAKAVALISKDKFKAVAQRFKLPEPPKNKLNDGREPVNINDNNEEEKSMPLSKEELAEIAQLAATAAVNAVNASKPTVPAPIVPEPINEVEEPFVGDVTNPEDVDSHAHKLKINQLKKATNFNDIDSVVKFQNAMKTLNGEVTAPVVPATNASITQPVIKAEGADAQKAQDKVDNKAAIARLKAKGAI